MLALGKQCEIKKLVNVRPLATPITSYANLRRDRYVQHLPDFRSPAPPPQSELAASAQSSSVWAPVASCQSFMWKVEAARRWAPPTLLATPHPPMLVGGSNLLVVHYPEGTYSSKKKIQVHTTVPCFVFLMPIMYYCTLIPVGL